MNFYTNVVLVGNEILSRGYSDGKHYKNRKEFYPTLYVKTNKKSKFKTLEGNYVEEVKPGTIRETREFISKYENVDNFELYGNTRYINQYISENFPGEIKFDITKIKLMKSNVLLLFSSLTSLHFAVDKHLSDNLEFLVSFFHFAILNFQCVNHLIAFLGSPSKNLFQLSAFFWQGDKTRCYISPHPFFSQQL